jgi:ATP-binding protein involved in chromosome partitioning
MDARLQIMGLVLNQSYFIPPSSETPYHLFGSADSFRSIALRLGVDALAELPLVPGVSAGGDKGTPYSLLSVEQRQADGIGGDEWGNGMTGLAKRIWKTWDNE